MQVPGPYTLDKGEVMKQLKKCICGIIQEKYVGTRFIASARFIEGFGIVREDRMDKEQRNNKYTHGSLIFRGVLKNPRTGWNKWLERTPAKPALVAEGQKEQ